MSWAPYGTALLCVQLSGFAKKRLMTRSRINIAELKANMVWLKNMAHRIPTAMIQVTAIGRTNARKSGNGARKGSFQVATSSLKNW